MGNEKAIPFPLLKRWPTHAELDAATDPFRKLLRGLGECDDDLRVRIKTLLHVATHVPDDIDIGVRWECFDLVVRLIRDGVWAEFRRNCFQIATSVELDDGDLASIEAALAIIESERY